MKKLKFSKGDRVKDIQNVLNRSCGRIGTILHFSGTFQFDGVIYQRYKIQWDDGTLSPLKSNDELEGI